jgi:hypothetical protein
VQFTGSLIKNQGKSQKKTTTIGNKLTSKNVFTIVDNVHKITIALLLCYMCVKRRKLVVLTVRTLILAVMPFLDHSILILDESLNPVSSLNNIFFTSSPIFLSINHLANSVVNLLDFQEDILS